MRVHKYTSELFLVNLNVWWRCHLYVIQNEVKISKNWTPIHAVRMVGQRTCKRHLERLAIATWLEIIYMATFRCALPHYQRKTFQQPPTWLAPLLRAPTKSGPETSKMHFTWNHNRSHTEQLNPNSPSRTFISNLQFAPLKRLIALHSRRLAAFSASRHSSSSCYAWRLR